MFEPVIGIARSRVLAFPPSRKAARDADGRVRCLGPCVSFWRIWASVDVTHESQVLSHHYLKANAVEAGKKVAKANQPSQLVVHREDGTFEYEHTYGPDPYPPQG